MEEGEYVKEQCLCVPERLGEKAILASKRLGILDINYRISRKRGEILLPLIREPTRDENQFLRCELAIFRLTEGQFKLGSRRRPTVRQILKGIVPPGLLGGIPRSMPTVGDIAIVEIPDELSGYDRQIGSAILTANPSLRTVLKKASSIQGTHRIREFKVIAGENRMFTVHREYGCTFHVDLSKVYFNPRLTYERSRVSSLVREGETILDMFAGVGPFSIQIAKKSETITVFAVDINPAAIEYLNRNIEANRVKNRIIAVEGDVEEIVRERLEGKVDRVIMNLPGSSGIFLNTACKALKGRGGVVHYYQFAEGGSALEAAVQDFRRGVEQAGRRVKGISTVRRVVATAPREWQVGIDANIR